MGTRSGERATTRNLRVRFIRNDGGPVAQVLHPSWVARHDLTEMERLLAEIESRLVEDAPEIQVVLTGGGFVELNAVDRANVDWHSERALETLLDRVRKCEKRLGEVVDQAPRCYVIGVDIQRHGLGVGQFALLLGRRQTGTIVWKSYPRSQEERWLAGFGAQKGLRSPRLVETPLGESLVLVCHDAQIFNHRSQANVRRARRETPRMRVMDYVQKETASETPPWAFKLIHYIGKPGSLNPFHTAYKQLHQDHRWRPRVVGAFGYEKPVRFQLETLSRSAQYPAGTARCTLALETSEVP